MYIPKKKINNININDNKSKYRLLYGWIVVRTGISFVKKWNEIISVAKIERNLSKKNNNKAKA